MEKITIIEIHPVAKPGKVTFWACKDSNGGSYSVWDKVMAETIERNLNIECEAEIKQAGQYWNIRQFVGVNITPAPERVSAVPAAPVVSAPVPSAPAAPIPVQASTGETAVKTEKKSYGFVKIEMLVSYAKDLVVAGKESNMESATRVVIGSYQKVSDEF